MSEEITASYKIEAAAFQPAFKWHMYRLTRWKWLALIVLSLSVPACCIISSHLHGTKAIAMAIVMPVLIALGAIIWYAVMMLFFRFVQKLQIRRLPAFGMHLSFSISDAGLRSTSGAAEAFLPWEMVMKSISTPHGALVYPQTNIFNWLPKTAFTSEADYNRFLDLLASKTKHSKLS